MTRTPNHHLEAESPRQLKASVGTRIGLIVLSAGLAAFIWILMKDFVPTLKGDDTPSKWIYVIAHDICITCLAWLGCTALWACFQPVWLEDAVVNLGKKVTFLGQSMVWVLLIACAITAGVVVVMIFRFLLEAL